MNQVKQLINETKKYLTKYDYNKVIELCDKILKIEPESEFGLRFNGIAHFQSGNYQKGLEYYNRLDKLYSNEDTRYTIAYLNEKLGNYEKALEYYDRNSKEKWIKSRRKRLLTNIKSYKLIIDKYDDKLKEIRNNDKSRSNIKRMITYLEEKGVFQYRNQEYDEARESFKMALTLYLNLKSELHFHYEEKVKKWYKMLEESLDKKTETNDFFNEIFNFKKHSEIWFNKLDVEFSEYEDSIVYPDLLLELNPEDVDLLKICAEKYEPISYDYSLDCWNKIIELDGENTEAIDEMLDIYSGQYSKDKSLKLIDQKLYIKDIRVKLLYRKIRILESMTLYDEALSVYDEYLSIDKEEESVTNSLTDFDKIRCMEQKALEYYLENNLKESYSTLKEVSKAFVSIKNSHRYGLWDRDIDKWYTFVLTDTINQSDDNPKLFFEKFHTLNDDTTDLWVSKINLLNDKNKLGNPITYCNILLNKNNNNIQLLLTKAYTYYNTNRLDEALDVYDTVIKLDDNNEAKNYKFNILLHHQQYMKAYEMLKSMKVEYPTGNNELSRLAGKLLKRRRYSESLYVYETMYELTPRIETVHKIKFLLIKTEKTEKLHNCKYHMKWIDLINYKYESEKCPKCNNKLIPIVYGYPSFETRKSAYEDEILLGGCCVSYDDPTHYCKHCKKNVNMGTYKISITEDDLELASYTRSNIRWITEYITRHPKNTIREIQKEAENIGIEHQELKRFIEKLEEINHIKREKDTLKIRE